MQSQIEKLMRNQCPSGGIGRRARFRCVCWEAWRFESFLGHQNRLLITWFSACFYFQHMDLRICGQRVTRIITNYLSANLANYFLFGWDSGYAGIVDGIKQQLGNNKRTTHNNFIYEVGQWYAAGDCRVGHWLHTFYILHLTSYIEGGWDTGWHILHLTSKRVGQWGHFSFLIYH